MQLCKVAVSLILTVILFSVSVCAGNSYLYINLPTLEMHWYQDEKLIDKFPVAIGTPGWPTPIGKFEVESIVEKPTWYPIDRDEAIPPGPENPLGPYWIGINEPSYGIHGTNEPEKIGNPITQGCIRVHNENIKKIASEINIGSPVIVDYNLWEVSIGPLGLYLEALDDIYGLYSPRRIGEIVAERGFPPDLITSGGQNRVAVLSDKEYIIPLQVEIKKENEPLGHALYYFEDVWISHKIMEKLILKDSGWQDWYKKKGQEMATMLPLSELKNGERYSLRWDFSKMTLFIEELVREDFQKGGTFEGPLHQFQSSKVLQEFPVSLQKGSSNIKR